MLSAQEESVGTTVRPAPHDVIGVALLESFNLPRHLADVLCDGHHLDPLTRRAEADETKTM